MSTTSPLCPICDAPVALAADTAVAELIPCPECGCDLEVLGVDPPLLAEAPCEEEDWGQ